MSHFALDQLFMHGHFVNPQALLASGLIRDPGGRQAPAVAAEPKRSERKRKKQHAQGGRYARA